MKCLCGKELEGRQKRFCSVKCKNKHNQNNSYEAQQKRGINRKKEIIQKMGGKCSKCGYNRNFAALEFHHNDETKKDFQLDVRSLSNRSKDKLITEVSKCILLCANCHRELHNPNHTNDLCR